jgi:hypothetical protein
MNETTCTCGGDPATYCSACLLEAIGWDGPWWTDPSLDALGATELTDEQIDESPGWGDLGKEGCYD